MTELQNTLGDFIELSQEEWSVFNHELIKKEFKGKSVLIREGSVANKLYIIESGLIRTYCLLDGKEVSTYFASDKQVISIFSSFISQNESFEILEAIEDCIVYELSYQSLLKLYKVSHKFERIGRILAEKSYLCTIDRTLAMQTKTAKQKYLEFLENYDRKIVQRVPQNQIASFLGIAPESLSRIRKEISIS